MPYRIPWTHPDQRLQPWPKGRGTASSGREIVKRDLYRTSVVGVSTAAGAPDSVGVAGLLSVGASADAGSMITMSATNPQNVSQGLRAVPTKRLEIKEMNGRHTSLATLLVESPPVALNDTSSPMAPSAVARTRRHRPLALV